MSLGIRAVDRNPEAGELVRDTLEPSETVRDNSHRRVLGKQLDVLVELLHGQQARLTADQVHVGNLTFCDRTDEPVNRRKIAELRPLGVVAEDTLLIARVRHLDVTEMRNRIMLDVLAVFASSSRPVITSYRCDRRPIRLNQRQRRAGTGLHLHYTHSFLVLLPFDWTA